MTTRRHFLRTTALGMAALPLAANAVGAADDLPNIVFIMADDLGYGDIARFNPKSTIPTPNVDRIAAQGVAFTNAHSGSAVCTPTRYGVVTGRYCWRSRLKRGVLNGYSSHLIDPARPTVASILRKSGYLTACVGKWHLGMDLPRETTGDKAIDFEAKVRNGPTVNGFDYFYGITASLDFPPYVYIENDRFVQPGTDKQPKGEFPAYLRAGEVAPDFKHIDALDHMTEKAVSTLNGMAAKKKPFFLYFPLTAPHKPVMPAKRFQGKSGIGPYGDFVMQVDWTVGQVDKALKSAGLADNTLVIMTSDNGSFMNRTDRPSSNLKETNGEDHVTNNGIQGYHPKNHLANGDLRGTKADVWEGGHRVPYVARWPRKVKPGRVVDETICHVDLMATCADIAGAKLPDNAAEDSFSILPLLLGNAKNWNRAPVVHHSASGMFAIREGKWKLILGSGSGGRGVPKGKIDERPFQLYDMVADRSETTNLIDKHPEVAQRLEKEMARLMEAGRSR